MVEFMSWYIGLLFLALFLGGRYMKEDFFVVAMITSVFPIIGAVSALILLIPIAIVEEIKRKKSV